MKEDLADADADIDEDAMIAGYLASQLGDFDCEPDAVIEPLDWPKGRGSKLLDQTLWVQHSYINCRCRFIYAVVTCEMKLYWNYFSVLFHLKTRLKLK